MKRLITATLTALTLGATPALACTEADVLARQDALVNAMQALLAVDPAKAQAIVADMQVKMDAAAEAGDGDAVCEIIDNAVAEATG